MIPVKEYVIIDFLCWLRENFPNIESLRTISDDKLLNLCKEFLGRSHTGSIDKILQKFSRRLCSQDRSSYWKEGCFEISYLCNEFHVLLQEYNDSLSREDRQSPSGGEFEVGIDVEQLHGSLKDFLNGYRYKDLAEQLRTREPEVFNLLIVSGDLEISFFVDWISHNHTEIDLLANIPNDVLKGLVFEFFKSRSDFKRFAAADSETLLQHLKKIRKGEYYKEQFEKLLERSVRIKKRNNEYIETINPLNRYKTVPLHAIFLYSSQHDYIQDYIIKNWGALSSMSGDYCDIYFSIDQLEYETDAFDVIDKCKSFRGIDIAKLPGIIFWEKDISKNYFLPFDNLDEKSLTVLVFTVFQQIRKKQILKSIVGGEKIFKKEDKKNKKAISKILQSNVTINVENAFGEVIGSMQGDLIKSGIDISALKEIFKTLELNKMTTERIKSLERTLRSNESAIGGVHLLIQELVKKNAHNKSFMSKMKDFAGNISTSVPGSIIANAIWIALLAI